MGIRAELHPQTLGGMDQALSERLADAEVLRFAHRWTGAAYLFGYVAEMAIKVRLFAHLGLASGTCWPAMRSAFHAQVTTLVGAGHTLDTNDLEGHHNLLVYGLVAVKSAGRTWSPQLKREYCRRVWEAHENWQFGLRYWPGTAQQRDVNRLAAAAHWLARPL